MTGIVRIGRRMSLDDAFFLTKEFIRIPQRGHRQNAEAGGESQRVGQERAEEKKNAQEGEADRGEFDRKGSIFNLAYEDVSRPDADKGRQRCDRTNEIFVHDVSPTTGCVHYMFVDSFYSLKEASLNKFSN